ncbi:unnamed protein product, partial [Allacma fusca]
RISLIGLHGRINGAQE